MTVPETPYRAADRSALMARAATAFLQSLDTGQRALARLDFADRSARQDWHYIPRLRGGLPLSEMDGSQRLLAWRLVGEGLSAEGAARVKAITGLEPVLAEIEGPDSTLRRDPLLYYTAIFGTPGEATWGWRFEGHHVSVNHTIVDGAVAATPLFFGSNPAQVRHGAQRGLRALAAEEDLGRGLLHELDGEQRRVAIVASEAPPDILTANAPRVAGPLLPSGLAASRMNAGQREMLGALAAVYIDRLPDAVAETQRRRLAEVAPADLYFAWSGAIEVGGPHYYRIQGPPLLAEYDNTQNDANHIHAVYRDLQQDFGDGLLRAHVDAEHHS